MYKHIIIISQDDRQAAYSSLRKLCNVMSGFSYDYLVRKKLPTKYKNWHIRRVKFNPDFYLESF